jgi:hypothetical protein
MTWRDYRAECFVTITVPPYTLYLSTRDILENGQWYDGVITSVSEIIDEFDTAKVAAGERLTLRIAPGNTQLRSALATDNVFLTALVLFEIRRAELDGSTYVANVVKEYAYFSHSVDANGITLTLSSIDDAALDETYPSTLYTQAEYPSIDPAAAGQPIAFPVGTAIKIPCRLLATQTLYDGTKPAPEWLYGVCELEWQPYPITAVNTGTRQFTVLGDCTAQLNVGDSIWVFDPNNRTTVTNEGKYTVSARTFSSPNTIITVNETVASATAACSVNIPPRILNVYRNGRLVNPTEWTVEVLDNGAGPVPATIGDFSTGVTDWSTSVGGTGTAALGGATATVTGDGGVTNWARVSLQAGRGGGLQQRRHQYAPWRITATGTGAAWLASNAGSVPSVGHGTLVRAGSPVRVLIKNAFGSADLRCTMITILSGVTGTNLVFDNWSIERPATPLLMLRFTREQRDPGGGLYTIEADVFGYRSRNVVDEIQRILATAGKAIESSSYGIALTYAATNRMLVDCDHGARGPKKRRAILEDLLFIARGGLRKDGFFGEYAITIDREPLSTKAYDESLGDPIEVQSTTRANLLRSVEIAYRPSSRTPSELAHTVRRDVFGATGIGVLRREVPYLRDHEAADRLLCYLQVRGQKPRKVRGRMAMDRLTLGQGVAVRNPNIFGGVVNQTFTGTVRSQRHSLTGVTFELDEAAAVDTYTAGTLPPDAVDTYTPDYSQTPPAAPTGLRITVAIAGSGRASVEARPPVENWAELWFIITHNTNNQIMGLVLATIDAVTGLGTATIGGLTTGQVYRLQAYAKNAFLLQGTIQSTFDNTINGGGAAVTTFTA